MAVVGGHQRDAGVPRQGDELRQHLPLLRDAVIHDLNKIVAIAKNLLHLQRVGARILPAILEQKLGQIAAQAGGQADEPFGILTKEGKIHPGTVVKPFGKAQTHQLGQVLVARLVFAQQDQVAVLPAHHSFVEAVGAHIHFAADHGMDARVLAGGIKIHRAVHHAVVGHGAMFHAKCLQALDEQVNAASAVQQAILRVQVKVCKRHGGLLVRGCVGAGGWDAVKLRCAKQRTLIVVWLPFSIPQSGQGGNPAALPGGLRLCYTERRGHGSPTVE